ncbi:MAG TPA: 30S ribosomal protein S18 [Chloroflexi bacterium]|nr:30S ribosomal protein S18 [Chloroflexota bacterium]
MAERDRGRDRDRDRSSSRKGYRFSRKRVCAFCADRADTIDYKDVPTLRQYITARGKIKPRRKTAVCARHQRRLSAAIKRARHVALLPYTGEHARGS